MISVKRVKTDDYLAGLYYMDDPNTQSRTFYRVIYGIVYTLIDTKYLFVYMDDVVIPNGP